MPAPPKVELNEMQTKLAALRKKDATLRVGSLADFDLNPRDALSTGNLSLDNATGVGGFPRGRVVELFGPPMSGKTTSALQAAAVHQRRVQTDQDAGAILFLDYERSLDETYCAKLGLDVHDADTFIYAQPDSFEQGANLFRALLEAGFLTLCIADSVAAMVSEKELAAPTGANTMADRAKALHQFMRQTTGALHRHRCTLIMLNHVMDLIDTSPIGQRMAAQGIRRKTTPGGTALGFYSSMRIEYKQVEEIKTTVTNPITNEAEKIVTATTVQAKVVKNKVSKPQRVARMRVRYGLGFSQPYSVLQVLIAYKIIKQGGSGWYTIPPEWSPRPGTEWKVQGEEIILATLEADREWMDRLEPKAHDLVASWTPDTDTDDYDYDASIDPQTGEVRDPTGEDPS